MLLIQTLPGESELSCKNSLNNKHFTATWGRLEWEEKSPCLSAALGWVDIKVAGYECYWHCHYLNALCHSCSGLLSHVWILGGLLIQNCITFYDKNQCKMAVIGAVSFSPVTGCVSQVTKSVCTAAKQRIIQEGSLSDMGTAQLSLRCAKQVVWGEGGSPLCPPHRPRQNLTILRRTSIAGVVT